ncbi:hypothetical protein MKW94_003497 [Papaver nudicaule]|uniref:Phytocyanin domain-containing protein n=1 Tax=Papaver nudicaule TaxID=74823 RepID=A0AA41S344_PAPNU|nr:hypothetical protein [Papaver nudicaule]
MATPSITTTALLVLLLLAPAVFAVDYPISWTLGTNYDDWVSDKTFFVGDTLTFTYGPSHSLSVVNKATYDTCGSDAQKNFNGGSNTVPLEVAGTMYFICPEGTHCSRGMKLSVNVSDGAPPAHASSPAGTPKPEKGTSAATSKYNMNFMVIGGSLLLAPLFALLG